VTLQKDVELPVARALPGDPQFALPVNDQPVEDIGLRIAGQSFDLAPRVAGERRGVQIVVAVHQLRPHHPDATHRVHCDLRQEDVRRHAGQPRERVPLAVGVTPQANLVAQRAVGRPDQPSLAIPPGGNRGEIVFAVSVRRFECGGRLPCL
jgi:hypothetical protein